MNDIHLNLTVEPEEHESEALDDVILELSQKLMEQNKEAYEKLSE